jgi:hypothetical protein
MGFAAQLRAELIAFDDLPCPHATNRATSLFNANSCGHLYHAMGFGLGCDQATINALHFTTVPASIVFSLPPPSLPGQPGVRGFADAGSDTNSSAMTSYRIERHEDGSQRGNGVASDHSLASARAPEPFSLALSAISLLATGGALLITGIRGRTQQ